MTRKNLIFVVDDDQVVNTLVTRRLEALGYPVRSFASGEECLDELAGDPDLIVLDYWFESDGRSSLNGLEVVERIRAVRPVLPIIILSGQENGEVVFELARKGISSYVIKDSSLADNLVHQVTDILRNDDK